LEVLLTACTVPRGRLIPGTFTLARQRVPFEVMAVATVVTHIVILMSHGVRNASGRPYVKIGAQPKTALLHILVATIYIVLHQAQIHLAKDEWHRIRGYVSFSVYAMVVLTAGREMNRINTSHYFYSGLVVTYYSVCFLTTKGIQSAIAGDIDAHKALMASFAGLPMAFSEYAGIFTFPMLYLTKSYNGVVLSFAVAGLAAINLESAYHDVTGVSVYGSHLGWLFGVAYSVPYVFGVALFRNYSGDEFTAKVPASTSRCPMLRMASSGSEL
jgi:uncharacterized membrane protein